MACRGRGESGQSSGGTGREVWRSKPRWLMTEIFSCFSFLPVHVKKKSRAKFFRCNSRRMRMLFYTEGRGKHGTRNVVLFEAHKLSKRTIGHKREFETCAYLCFGCIDIEIISNFTLKNSIHFKSQVSENHACILYL